MKSQRHNSFTDKTFQNPRVRNADPRSAGILSACSTYSNIRRPLTICRQDAGVTIAAFSDPLNNETHLAYGAKGNMTQVTDALNRVTQYAYDAMGKVTQVTSPSGSGNTMTMAYNDLGLITSKTGFGGKTTTYEYDHVGQLTKVTDPVDDIQTAYDSLGNVSTVTDGLGHTTTYSYDYAHNRLTKVTDAIGKVTCYFYDSAGRKTKVGAGASGTIDPTEYFYSGTTGLLTKVTYTAGGSTYDAEYEYDGNARLVNLLDWIDDVDGLEYAYDAAGRMTQLTDYDGSTLDYAYDAAGRVTSMNDYFSHETTYTYTDTGQVSTITAPGSKVWTYAYNALGQPTSVSIPNAMTTEYGYDTRNRLTKIEHKDGANVLDGFTYALDDSSDITRTTHADGSLWDYEYDGRSRLTKAERYDTDGTTLLHRYSYTYDDGDNLVTKAVYDGTNTTTSTFAYTDANEQTSMSVGGTTTSMAYDAWGRMTSKTDESYSAAYAYRYGDNLYSVTSDFPGEGTVTYEYGGDGKRRERSVSGVGSNRYNWGVGFNVINEEHSNGTLSMTYTVDNPMAEVAMILADASTTNPVTGTYRFYNHDNLGSTRRLRASDKSSLGAYEYTPYGQAYATSGVALGALAGAFTGKAWDDTSQLYYFPYRYYSPDAARWLTYDSMGMIDGPNMYAYVGNGPVAAVDVLGLYEYQVETETHICVAWVYIKTKIKRPDGTFTFLKRCTKWKKKEGIICKKDYSDLLNCYAGCWKDFAEDFAECQDPVKYKTVAARAKCETEAYAKQITCTNDCVDEDCSK